MVITTTRVLVYPDAGTAETAEPVRLESPNGWVTAVGAKAFLHDKRVDLHSQVKEYYVKPPKD
jgi:lipopolysaccharide export system protein LptC